jgi:hypothetical protein
MVPAAIGTQVGGSLIRPASYCGNCGLKPTMGALHRGERQGYSQSHVGVHAGSLTDMWRVAMEIARRAGGDPGHPGLFGAPDLSPALQPARLIVMETAGWAELDAKTREGFDRILAALRDAGVEVLSATDDPLIEAFEHGIAEAKAITTDICDWENRWSFENLVEQYPGKYSDTLYQRLQAGRKLSLDDYRLRLLQREEAKNRLAAIAPLADALISLGSPGPAPHGLGSTGDSVFNSPTSILGAPAVTVPMLGIEGMPVNVAPRREWSVNLIDASSAAAPAAGIRSLHPQPRSRRGRDHSIFPGHAHRGRRRRRPARDGLSSRVIDAAAANKKFPVPFLIGRPAAVLTPLFRHYAGMACHSPASARPPSGVPSDAERRRATLISIAPGRQQATARVI